MCIGWSPNLASKHKVQFKKDRVRNYELYLNSPTCYAYMQVPLLSIAVRVICCIDIQVTIMHVSSKKLRYIKWIQHSQKCATMHILFILQELYSGDTGSSHTQFLAETLYGVGIGSTILVVSIWLLGLNNCDL